MGKISRTASESSPTIPSAAIAAAGAVLRPSGSSRIEFGATPMARSCSATRNLFASLQTIVGGANRAPVTRSAVSCNMDCSDAKDKSCFGVGAAKGAKAVTRNPRTAIRGESSARGPFVPP